MAGLFQFASNLFNRALKVQLEDKIRELEAKNEGNDIRLDNIVNNSGNSVTELVDARTDEKNVVHPNLKKRLDTISAYTTTEINKLKEENKGLADKVSPSGIPQNAGIPTFTRAATRDYKGRTYAVNAPVYDAGGVVIDPTLNESLTIPTANILNATQGTVEATVIPLQIADTVNYCRIDFATTGRFLFYITASGRCYFSIDEWGGAYVSTGTGVAKVNEPLSFALRWNDRAKEYSLFVNGKYIGTKYYDKAVKGDFGPTMTLAYAHPVIFQKLRFSHIARPDKELIY